MPDDTVICVVEYELEPGNSIESFMETVGQNLPYVLTAQQLDLSTERGGMPIGEKLDFTTGQF